MNPIDLAIQYVKTYDPGIRLLAADPGTLEKIQRINPSLPSSYIDFLQRLGGGADWIQLRQIDMNAEAVLRKMEERAWTPPPRFTLIGVDQGEAGYNLYLASSSAGDIVVSFPDLEPEDQGSLTRWMQAEAGSMAELLCRPVFQAYRIARRINEETFIRTAPGQVPALSQADAIAARSGLEKLWFSNNFRGFYDSAETSAMASKPPGFGLSVRVAGDTSDFTTIRDRFVEDLGLVPYRK
jgi:hypothetical protein